MMGRSTAALEESERELRARGLDISTHQLDVTDTASVARAMADVAYEYGRIDVLINNAAIAIDRGQDAATADMERVIATLNTNLVGAWRCCTAAIPEMRRGGYGRIVNVTTHMASLDTMTTGSVAYRVSKTGLNALTRILADELRSENILVNAASPGKVATRMAYGRADRQPDEAVETLVWLATLPDEGPTGGLFADRQPLAW
jgi:NAD(P)-dependent dehydrogenase (short-subunit alcohol dehydrogenase family)